MSPSAQSLPPSPVVQELQREIANRGLTAYALAKQTGLRLSTMQRLMAGQGSPTIATLDSVAHAIGLRIRTEPASKLTGL